jgi:hypothetical protein
MSRLYKGSVYRPSSRSLTLRPPAEADRIGAPTLRDAALLGFCAGVLDAISGSSAR